MIHPGKPKIYFLCSRIVLPVFSVCIISLSACIGITKHAKGIEPSMRPVPEVSYELVDPEPVDIEVSSFNLFWLVPVTPDLKVYETVKEAVSNKGGDNLIDVTIWREKQYWIVGTVDIMHIRGKVIRFIE